MVVFKVANASTTILSYLVLEQTEVSKETNANKKIFGYFAFLRSFNMTDFYLITIFGDKDFRQNLFLDSFGEYSHSCTL